MQRGFQRRLRTLFQSCGQTLEPLSELLDSFPCVIFLLCLPLRHLHNNHDRVRTDVTLPDSHTHAHVGGRGEHRVCSDAPCTYPSHQQSILNKKNPPVNTKWASCIHPSANLIVIDEVFLSTAWIGINNTFNKLWPPESGHIETKKPQKRSVRL